METLNALSLSLKPAFAPLLCSAGQRGFAPPPGKKSQRSGRTNRTLALLDARVSFWRILALVQTCNDKTACVLSQFRTSCEKSQNPHYLLVFCSSIESEGSQEVSLHFSSVSSSPSVSIFSLIENIR